MIYFFCSVIAHCDHHLLRLPLHHLGLPRTSIKVYQGVSFAGSYHNFSIFFFFSLFFSLKVVESIKDPVESSKQAVTVNFFSEDS